MVTPFSPLPFRATVSAYSAALAAEIWKRVSSSKTLIEPTSSRVMLPALQISGRIHLGSARCLRPRDRVNQAEPVMSGRSARALRQLPTRLAGDGGAAGGHLRFRNVLRRGAHGKLLAEIGGGKLLRRDARQKLRHEACLGLIGRRLRRLAASRICSR